MKWLQKTIDTGPKESKENDLKESLEFLMLGKYDLENYQKKTKFLQINHP